MFLLDFRNFTHVMPFAGTEKHHRNSANKRDAFPKAKSHNAQGE
jgi:hypothetical protein